MKKNVLLGSAFIITFLLGIGIGGAANAPAPVAAPPPVTTTVPGPPTFIQGPTITETVTGPTVRVTVKPKAAAKPKAPAIPNTIEDGTWEVGVDIQAGTYKTRTAVASSFCYWKITTVGRPDDIIDNDIVQGGRPIVTIRKGQMFKSQECGTWAKVIR